MVMSLCCHLVFYHYVLQTYHLTKFDTLSELCIICQPPLMQMICVSVRRSDVLASALCGIDRKAFTPNKFLQVHF